MAHISDIKLIRTDTTLDLSQKAEKGMNWNGGVPCLLIASRCCVSFPARRGGTKNERAAGTADGRSGVARRKRLAWASEAGLFPPETQAGLV